MQSNNEGVNRVVSSDETYAFLMESNSIQYQIGMQTYKIVFKNRTQKQYSIYSELPK